MRNIINNELTEGWPPMSVGYVNLVRYWVKEAIKDAINNRVPYTPVFWIGQHIVRIPMVVPV